MRIIHRSPGTFIVIISVLICVTCKSALIHATEKDNDFSRPTYSLQEVNEDKLGDKITFNSIIITEDDKIWYEKETGKEIPTGTLKNETNFVGARVDNGVNAGKNNVWNGTEIEAEDGKTYVIRLYVHNNNPNGMNAVAENTQVRFYVPYGSSDSVQVNGWLKADNADAGDYDDGTFLDDVTFKSKDGNPFHLEYVYGSALLENGGFAKGGGVKMPNTVVNQGDPALPLEDSWTLIGYDGFDGKIPGCYKFVNYVTIRVKVVYDYDFTIETKVRLADDIDKTWNNTVKAKVGDKVEFQLTYTNTSNQRQDNVQVRDILPSNLRYVEGSTRLKNALFPDILYITDGDPSDVLHGINIGNYEAGANAHIMFTAEVVDDNLTRGKNTLVNWGQSSVGEKTLQDNASVNVSKNNNIYFICITVLFLIILICIVIIIRALYKIHSWKKSYK